MRGAFSYAVAVGRIDWESPHFVYLDHVCENPEPPGYVLHFFTDRREGIAWLVALVRTGLAQVVDAKTSESRSLSDDELISEIRRLIETRAADALVRATETCRNRMNSRNIMAFGEAIREQARLVWLLGNN